VGGIVLGRDGNLYGVTTAGGANSSIDCDGQEVTSCGTIFKLTPSGELTTLYSFCSQPGCTDGSGPQAALVQGFDGNFYGMTPNGGAGGACSKFGFQPSGCGTIFKITPAGILTTLYSFCVDSCVAGWAPNGSLVLMSDGDFYGVTNFGGTGTGGTQCESAECGTIFRVTPKGAVKNLHSFCVKTGCPDGSHPQGIVLGTNGVLYGTTGNGGAHDDGTVFSFTQSNVLTTLYSFCSEANCADGSGPEQPLIQGSDGNLYGTTTGGGVTSNCSSCGTLFEITPAGKLTTLYSFCAQTDCFDGAGPSSALFQSTTGVIYGNAGGGNPGDGVIFSWTNPKLPRFVEPVPTGGDVGSLVRLLGNDLTGASAVTFNGVDATFKVVSSTEITATVPTGATSGNIGVVTPTASLSSNVAYVVQ
jgi:uncharacterized repeat protein (TIGR03803 family)